MKGSESPRSINIGEHSRHHAVTFAKVLDGRKQPIRGLWKRGTRYYGRLNVEDALTGKVATRRIPLIDKDGRAVQTTPQAVAELKRLQTQRSDNALPIVEQTPKFKDYADRYLTYISSGQGAKKPGTIEKERGILGRWSKQIGNLRLDQIKRVHANQFIENRLNANVAPRTVNLDVITFRVVMKRALSDGLIQRVPTEGLKPLKTTTVKRPLFTTPELDALCSAAFETKNGKDGRPVPISENAQQLVDYLRLMSYSGARRNEALGVKWDDVDFQKGQLYVRRQITKRGVEELKNREERRVEFNSSLRALLLDMQKRRAPDSVWLFPSSQRGDKDTPAKTFRESMLMVRERALLQRFGFHDCRHHFVSMCVMSGVDYMTIAEWVGHKDGGILIGKVYGHLADEHRKRMGDKVVFSPVLSETGIASA